ncbi:MAG TPA: hypothetical protein DCK95_03740 [Anaerolineaceae bacterium]|nr:hypothetical protein [Anaerolineaceae bacterium]
MLEETKKRLENIQAIEPYLNAMRNSSLGSWKTAINRIHAIHLYRADLLDILKTVTPNPVAENTTPPSSTLNPQIWIVIGSQKGLVSNFNRRLLSLIEKEIKVLRSDSKLALPQVHVVTNKPTYYSHFLSETELQADIIPFNYDLSYNSAVNLFNIIPESSNLAYDLYYFYNVYGKSQVSAPIKQAAIKPHRIKAETQEVTTQWPPYVLDSDAAIIQEQVQNMLAYLEFQEVLTNSIASENSFRHRILEEAKNNTDRLIHELTIEISMSRKKEITKEIQELAVAAGLIQ